VSFERCQRCVLSSAFPGLAFDAQGVCSFCRGETLVTSEESAIELARKKVKELFEVRTRPYDAILCNSGGKDSSYTLKLAVNTYGLRVLSFTLDNGFLSATAFRNIGSVVDALGVDHVVVRPAMRVYREIMKASALLPIYRDKTLTRISAGCNSCISMVNTMAIRLALEKGAPVVLAGFTLGQIPANAIVYRNNFRFLAESRAESLGKLRDAVGPEVDEYYGIVDSLLDRAGASPYNVNLLCLERVTEEEIVREVEALGWRRPTDVDGCSSNCQLNTFNNYVHERRFGFSPYELELSHLIRKGLMSRQEALEKMADQPREQLVSIARRLEMPDSQAETLGISLQQPTA
jgi:hypothetical protein